MEKHALIWIQTGSNLGRDAQSWLERFVDCLSRYLSLPADGQTKRDHGAEDAWLLLQNVAMQNGTWTNVESPAVRARIAGWHLLHDLVLDPDSFLPDFRPVPYSAF